MAKPNEKRHPMLRVEQPGKDVRLEDLVRDEYTVGRGGASTHVDFRIENDAAVSRLQLTLRREDEGWALENHSSNGSDVNGKTVHETQSLKSGDKIYIGEATTLELLLLTASERSRSLSALAPADGEEELVEEGSKKSLFQSPAMLGVLVFYGLLAVLVISLLNTEKRPGPIDPGDSGYFAWVIEDPIQPPGKGEPVGEMGEEERIKRARDMWADSLSEHGGKLIDEAEHAYVLMLRARTVLYALGETSVRKALGKKEPVAMELGEIHERLQARLSGLYTAAKLLEDSGRPIEARVLYMTMLWAVPNADEPLHRYAYRKVSAPFDS